MRSELSQKLKPWDGAELFRNFCVQSESNVFSLDFVGAYKKKRGEVSDEIFKYCRKLVVKVLQVCLNLRSAILEHWFWIKKSIWSSSGIILWHNEILSYSTGVEKQCKSGAAISCFYLVEKIHVGKSYKENFDAI